MTGSDHQAGQIGQPGQSDLDDVFATPSGVPATPPPAYVAPPLDAPLPPTGYGVDSAAVRAEHRTSLARGRRIAMISTATLSVLVGAAFVGLANSGEGAEPATVAEPSQAADEPQVEDTTEPASTEQDSTLAAVPAHWTAVEAASGSHSFSIDPDWDVAYTEAELEVETAAYTDNAGFPIEFSGGWYFDDGSPFGGYVDLTYVPDSAQASTPAIEALAVATSIGEYSEEYELVNRFAIVTADGFEGYRVDATTIAEGVTYNFCVIAAEKDPALVITYGYSEMGAEACATTAGALMSGVTP